MALKSDGKLDLSEQARPPARTKSGAKQGQNGPELVYSAPAKKKLAKDFPIYFDKRELGILLNVYGKHVAQGEWRDYAMDFSKDRAMFSIYRRNSEQPMFVVEKQPKLRLRQGQYLVINQAGRILRRGHDLKQVLRVFESKSAMRSQSAG